MDICHAYNAKKKYLFFMCSRMKDRRTANLYSLKLRKSVYSIEYIPILRLNVFYNNYP